MQRLAVLFLLSLLCAHSSAAQTVPVVIRVLSEDGPLANAEVIDHRSGGRALTRSSGEATVQVNRAFALSLRVRQLGFAYQDLTLLHSDLLGDGRDTVVVRLQRTAFAIAPVTTTVASDCPRIGAEDVPLAFWALSQLREGAERYASFGAAYPFRVTLKRTTSVQWPGDAKPSVRESRDRVESSRWGERYSPASVVSSDERGFSVPILSVRALGDPAFWDRHCVTMATIEGDRNERRVRLSFVPGPSVRNTDWAGSAVIDSATSVLQRLDFQLDVRQRSGPRRLEGFTTFTSPSPFISIPDRTAAIWWYDRPQNDEPWGPPNMVQLLSVDQVQYRNQSPPVVPR